MSLGKKDIVKNISSRAQISKESSKQMLDKLIELISSNSFINYVKISNFGTFYLHRSPKRMGRNPKTKEEFIIKERKKIAFSPSKKIKNLIN